MVRPLVLTAAFGLMLWYLLSGTPDNPGSYQARAEPGASTSGNTTEHEPWSREERAVWRDGVDQRLRR